MLAIDFSPKVWEDIKCQSQVVNTLRAMITNNRPPKSTLFIGKTGVGKTSIAKILAASIVCKNKVEGNPCGTCLDCLDIFNDCFTRSVRYINGVIDSGIDFYRKELDSLTNFTSFFNPNKVMIVDEVHGLSKESLQAFLLPTESKNQSDIYFIFATTEGQAVKATLVTRCIDFKLKVPSEIELAKVLYEKVSEKKLRLPQEFLVEGLYEISCASNGSFRYSFNLLDKILVSKVYSLEKIREFFDTEIDTDIMNFIKLLLEKKVRLAIAEMNKLLKSEDIFSLFNTLFRYLVDIQMYIDKKIPCSQAYYLTVLKNNFSSVDSELLSKTLKSMCEIQVMYSNRTLDKSFFLAKLLELEGVISAIH